MSTGKKGLSREDAAELYEDLRKAMAQAKSGVKPMASKPAGASAKSSSTSEAAKQIAAEISKALSKDTKESAPKKSMNFKNTVKEEFSFDPSTIPAPRNRGAVAAIAFVLLFGLMRVTLGALEALGLAGIQTAQATMKTPVMDAQPFGREEVKVLTALDSRRADLADKGKKLEEREKQLDIRDREFAVRVAQLKDLTDQLKNEREKDDKKRSTQTEQLANVYSSMSAPEAAQLMEQLDIQIALSLIERMPEKKIGQILALMTPQRALTLTKLLSGRTQG